MILVNETFEKFGYYPESLSRGSKKKIMMKCDYCSKDFEKVNRDIYKYEILVNKDCCFKCKHRKIEEVNLIKYGAKNQFLRPEIMDVLNPLHAERLKTQDFKDKRSKTCIEKYGTDNMQHVPEIVERTKATNLEKFGYENPMQNQDIQDKAMNTMIERYGAAYMSTPQGKARVEELVKEKYGVSNVFQLEEVKEKAKQTCFTKYGFSHHMKDKQIAIKNARNSIEARIQKGDVILHNGLPISHYAKESEYSKGRFKTLAKLYGTEKALAMTPRLSSLEQIMGFWLNDLGLEYHKNYIENRRPDFVLEKYKLVLEANGSWYHGSERQSDQKYEMKKMDFYISKGYDSMFFREDEIICKESIIKKLIKEKVDNVEGSIESPEIVQVSDSDIKLFISQNHLFNPVKGCANLFLRSNGVILACIQYKVKDGTYKVGRFCCGPGVSRGAAFKAFLAYFNPKWALHLYVDRRFGACSYLDGFTLESCRPSYSWTNGEIVVPKRIFPDGPDTGFYKLWDCGQAKYVKTK